MGDEGFALVALRRAMRVDIVDVWKVDLESIQCQSYSAIAYAAAN